MENYFEKLRTYIVENPPDFGDGDSILTMLCEAYADYNRMDNNTIKEDFREKDGRHDRLCGVAFVWLLRIVSCRGMRPGDSTR